jgi:hypothetical protein
MELASMIGIFYIWKRVDGRPRSPFGRLSAVAIVLSLVTIATIPFGLDNFGPYWLVGMVATGLGLARSRLLIDLGRNDPALPRLTGTFRMAALYAVSRFVFQVLPLDSPVSHIAADLFTLGIVWGFVWSVIVNWRLLRETGPSIRVGLNGCKAATPLPDIASTAPAPAP